MGISVRGRHPSQRGLVMLTGWVSSTVRNHAKQSAVDEKMLLSEWLASAVEAHIAHLQATHHTSHSTFKSHTKNTTTK